MTQVMGEVSMELFGALQEALDGEQACEHPGHKYTVLGTHAGPGQWYANIRCPECNSHRVYVMCGPFKRHVEADGGLFHCRECMVTLPASELVVGFTRIGEGL